MASPGAKNVMAVNLRASGLGVPETEVLPTVPVCCDELGELFRRDGTIWKSIANFAGRILRDFNEGEDVAQETCARVFRAVRSGKEIHPAALYAFCRLTAYRLVLTEFERRKRFADDAPRKDIGEPDPWEERVERHLSLVSALEGLPARERRVLQLSLEGCPDEEAATFADAGSANNLRQICYRAVRRVHARMRDGRPWTDAYR